MKTVKFNVNWNVRVKLTDEGKRELERRHNELKSVFPKIGDYKPKPEEDGWTKFQMHELMENLGAMVSIGRELPFETNIELLPE